MRKWIPVQIPDTLLLMGVQSQTLHPVRGLMMDDTNVQQRIFMEQFYPIRLNQPSDVSGIVFHLNAKLDRDSSFTLEESKRSEETSLMGRCLGNIIGDSEINLLQISQEINATYEIIFSSARVTLHFLGLGRKLVCEVTRQSGLLPREFISELISVWFCNCFMLLYCIPVLQDFPKSPRSKVVATEYQWASIECNPPKHYPGMRFL